MKLSEVKTQLATLSELKFQLPDGSLVPSHFHVTEVGVISKHFIDCGGTVRKEKVANFQLWQAEDYDHRLAPKKLIDIIQLSEKVLEMEDFEVEVEYQGETIGKYGLAVSASGFALTNRFTDCLAKDNCGIPPVKQKVRLGEFSASNNNACEPGSGCC
ncbi:MAG: DUF6428 family protein [Bacteroidia bacterium]